MAARIREAEGDEDLSFMLGLSSRLSDVIDTGLHEPAEIAWFQEAYSAANLRERAVSSLTLIAERDGERLGFLHALPSPDGIVSRDIGYVALLAVIPSEEGKGLARLLLDRAEAWARRQGYAALALDVFCSNGRGRRFYEKNGFSAQTMRMIKPL